MRRMLKHFAIIIFIMLLLPVKTKAETLTYSIDKAVMNDTRLSIMGWAYFVEQNFCNSDNRMYEAYKIDDGVSVVKKCAGKGYNSVKYQLYLVPENGNAERIYFKNDSSYNNTGSTDNLRYTGISATCVNYYKATVNGQAVHCDGALSNPGEIPAKHINYLQRNKNVQNNAGGQISYFYDDIGFSGYIDLKQLVPEIKYTLYLDITLDGGVPHSFKITMPGVFVSTGGETKLDSTDSKGDKTYVGPNETKYVIGALPESGTINQDYTMPYYIDASNTLKQKAPSSGGGYFKESYSYSINSILDPQHNTFDRTGGFKFLQLGTTGNFEKNYIYPGAQNNTYYAIAPWVDFSGTFTIVRHVTEDCGGTIAGSNQRIAYCDNNPKPSDYNKCCAEEQVGICELETTDEPNLITPTPYTFWDTDPTKGADVETEVNTQKHENVENYPKYCSGTDFTNTMYNEDYRGNQALRAFCYQEGGFTTSSNTRNDKNYILTYVGGAYTLNVEYKTKLVCTSLKERKITEIRYYNPSKDCLRVATAESDGEVKFIDDDSDGKKLNYNKYGIFNVVNDESNNTISNFVSQIKKVPTLHLKDTTTDQITATLKSEMTIDNYDSIDGNGDMKTYIEKANENDPRTRDTFVQKLELTKKITSEDNYSSGVMNRSCSCFDVPSEEEDPNYQCSCTPTEVSAPAETVEYEENNYYGTLERVFGRTDSGCSRYGCHSNIQYHYEGEVRKLMYITIQNAYKTEYLDLNFKYTIPPEAIPQSIRDRFENASGEKYVSQINLSDYYQIVLESSNYKKGSGEGFGIASNWDIDKAMCILDVTSYPKVCDPTKEDCDDLPYCDPTKQKCKDDNDPIGDHYTDTFAYRIVSTTALFPGTSFSGCKNPTGMCRQPGRNWNNYLKSDQKSAFLLATNIDYTPKTPMYHITLSPSTMNKIISENKDYYTNITLGSWYNPKECINSSDRCSSDYESAMLDKLGNSIFTRNRKIIYDRYKTLSQYGVNEYLTSKEATE